MCCGKTMPRHLSWKFGPQKAKGNLCSTHLALQWSNSMPMWQPPAAERGSPAPPSLQPLGPMLFLVAVMTFFRPFAELWPSKWAIWICVLNPCLSGMRSKNHPPDTTFQLVHFPSGERKPAGSVWEHDVMLGKQRPGMLLRISSVQIRTSRSKALAFCAPQSQTALGAEM